jgi:hypothetical protein
VLNAEPGADAALPGVMGWAWHDWFGCAAIAGPAGDIAASIAANAKDSAIIRVIRHLPVHYERARRADVVVT